MTALLVEPRWGRRGHGSRLLAAGVEGWRADGVDDRRRLGVGARRGHPRFLASAGWEPDGRSRGLDTGRAVQRQLRFHVDVAS